MLNNNGEDSSDSYWFDNWTERRRGVDDIYPLATRHALYLYIVKSTLCLTRKIHLQLTGMMDGFGGTSSQVPCLTKALNSSDIAYRHL